MTYSRPLAIDLFCGLGGWTEGLLAAGYYVVGFDIEQHVYGDMRYPAQLVVQDVLTLHGSQFRNAALIVASPPCQEYSYMAMPWKLAKAKAAAIRADETGHARKELTKLFDACFRIQREACEAAGRHIPMVVENVRGANEWVGRARWSYGSFYLWGDVPALMPQVIKAKKFNPDGTSHPSGSWFAIADSKNRGARSDGQKVPGFRFDGSGRSFQTASVEQTGIKGVPHRTKGHWTNPAEHHSDDNGRKIGGDWFSDPQSTCRKHGSKSKGRKMASAMIAKIPLPLSAHIAKTYFPREMQTVAA